MKMLDVGLKRILPVLVLATVVGCAAAPIVDEYPTREIDQPFTLPKGMASWQTILGYEAETEPNDDYVYRSSILYPLIWNQALSDTWQLTWMPFPLQVSHQIQRDETGYWGARLGIGGAYRSRSSGSDDWLLIPSPTLVRRQIFSPDFALDLTAFGNFRVPLSNGDSWESDWDAGISVAPLFQVTNHFSVGPFVTAISQKQTLVSIDFTVPDPFRVSVDRSIRFPLGLHTQWRLSRRWQMDGSYTYGRLGYPSGYTRNTLQANFQYFW